MTKSKFIVCFVACCADIFHLLYLFFIRHYVLQPSCFIFNTNYACLFNIWLNYYVDLKYFTHFSQQPHATTNILPVNFKSWICVTKNWRQYTGTRLLPDRFVNLHQTFNPVVLNRILQFEFF